MLVGIGQCRFIRRFADSQVHQFAKAAGETLRTTLGTVLSSQRRKLTPRKMPEQEMLEQLIQEAHRLYHRLALLLALR